MTNREAVERRVYGRETTTVVVAIESQDDEEECARCRNVMRMGTQKVEVDFRDTPALQYAEACGATPAELLARLRDEFPGATTHDWGAICRTCEAEVFTKPPTLPKYSVLCSETQTLRELFDEHPSAGAIVSGTEEHWDATARGYVLTVEIVPHLAGLLEYFRGVKGVDLAD